MVESKLVAGQQTPNHFLQCDGAVRAAILQLGAAPLPPAEDPARRRLRLRFEHGAFSAWIDGTPCFIDQRFPKMDADLSVRPGLGAFYHAENARCLFRNVRLRALAPAEFP